MPTIEAGNRVFHVTDIDREECSRIVPMRVLSLGLTRTGSECECLPVAGCLGLTSRSQRQ